MRRRLFSILAACAILIGSVQVGTLHVQAGSSDIVVNNTSFATELDSTTWNAPNADVNVENGKIVFSKDSTAETRLITRKGATKTEYYDELFNTSYTLKLSALPADQKFIVAYSLLTAESYAEENGNFEVVFTNNGGVKVSVRAFGDDGTEQVLVDKANCGIKVGSAFTMSVSATKDMKTKVVVNGKTVYHAVAPISMEGRMGFMQSGNCAAEIQTVNIVSHAYERPENANIVEDFEKGSMDKNTLTSIMTRNLGFFPAGIYVEEYNGSNVLMFNNVSQGFFGTRYQYSNFEVSFDIPYVLRKNIVDEDGNVSALAHGNFVLGIGDESDVYSNYGYQQSAEALVISPDSISSFTHGKDGVSVQLAGKGYYDQQKNEGYSVKVSVVDTQIKVYVKALGATKYDEVLNYKVGQATPLGYVHIWSTGLSNFAIDNFKLTNLDKDANVLDLEYEAATIKPEADWEYKEREVVYLDEVLDKGDKTATEEQGFKWSMLLVYGGIAGVVILATCTVVTLTGKKKKEEQIHES